MKTLIKIKNIIGLSVAFGIGIWYISQFMYAFGLVAPQVSAHYAVKNEELTFMAEPVVISDIEFDKPEEDYKTTRIKEMADYMEHDPILKPHTVRLIAMLLLEDGTLTAERRHDCHGGVCYAIGIQGHHICYRGTPLVAQDHGKEHKTYCHWKNGKSPQQQFEEEYPEFAFNWYVQFMEYTKRMRGCLRDTGDVDHCIQLWNSREVGRIQKVKSREPVVLTALGW